MSSVARKLLSAVTESENNLREYFGIAERDVSILDRTGSLFHISLMPNFAKNGERDCFLRWGETVEIIRRTDNYSTPIANNEIHRRDDLVAIWAGDFGEDYIFVFNAEDEVKNEL